MTALEPRVGVYNRYWDSHGGGERHSGMLAQVLAEYGGRVDLIAHNDIDRDRLSEYLGLDLSRCRLRTLPDVGDSGLSSITSDYRLFVNASYMSRLVSRAPRSAYLCYFPTPADHDLAAWRRAAIRTFGALAKPSDTFVSLSWGTGWFPPEGGRRRSWTWTNGDGRMQFAPGSSATLRFDLARVGASPADLSVTMNGIELLTVTASERFRPVRVTIPAAAVPRSVRFTSPTFVPNDTDRRTLGVAVSRMRFSGGGINPRERIALRLPWLLRDPRDVGFVDSYDVVLANSRYTADWIARLWHHSAQVLYPPIQVTRFQPAPDRTRTIVSVGRFFAPGQGHSKRQLEQVQAFEAIVRSGRLPGWRLHLVGGCEPVQKGYLDKVRAAAEGLPVEIHANAPRHELESLLSTASIQWSATGYGEDDAKTPWTSEHFGMTTVEAMSAGCVPIVIDKAGQREIVRDGVDGFRWSTLEQLTDRTVQVARDDALRARLSSSARERAQQYSDAAFAENVRELIERHDLL